MSGVVTGVESGTDAPLLFLSHAADRTGPPIYLLHLLRWLRRHHPEVEFELAFLAGGELEADFRALAPARMSVYEGFPPSRYDDEERAFLLEHLDLADLWWAVRREQQLRRQMRRHAGCRVVHVNSAPSAELARLLPAGERTLLSHVHDLEIGLTHRLAAPDRQVFLHEARRLFAASEAVRTNLVDRHGVDRSIIALHHEMVDAAAQPTRERSPEVVAAGRVRRGLPVDGLLVGASGTLDWRKAPDLFLRLAWHLTRVPRSEPVTFVWVGGDAGGVERSARLAADLGIDHLVRFVGVQPDPVEWFALLDVFVLPSREDPFPLVCLEALSVGVPVVAFDTGGMPELLAQGCGLVSPYPDAEHLASQVDELLLRPDHRRALGERGRELIAANHDVTVLAPRMWADIARWLP